jgi:hypothetical protein
LDIGSTLADRHSPRLVLALNIGRPDGRLIALAASRPTLHSFSESDPAVRHGSSFGPLRGFVTVHPSSLLRLPNEVTRGTEYQRFVADLREVGAICRMGSALGSAHPADDAAKVF